VVRAPGTPVPIAGLAVRVLAPAPVPPALAIAALTDDHGGFVLSDISPPPSGRVRLFIDGSTPSGGAGGPYLGWNAEVALDSSPGGDVGRVRVATLEPAGTAALTPHH